MAASRKKSVASAKSRTAAKRVSGKTAAAKAKAAGNVVRSKTVATKAKTSSTKTSANAEFTDVISAKESGEESDGLAVRIESENLRPDVTVHSFDRDMGNLAQLLNRSLRVARRE